ncbi:capsular exopolysaccharide synthesis family protein [Catalinimonas alkaloidigena]|uniref:GumC family protein n=1 Tax=Catalinimonas alkaloidigena TaxID=1075417 RepID=UPI002404DDB5|nr:polysaccharide biosynthesis tyrosine autokinase [Catalinimonas alkaloidigena]MDF9796740.1 capsular exopolysaccharide synthesis family protein [Catalinimonas alkaloidigena]
MENIKKVNEGSADILPLLYKIKSKWYWFVLSTLAFLTIAVIYSQFSEKRYAVQGSILFEDRERGSTEVGELLNEGNRTNARDEGKIALTNEIAKLTSDRMISAALEDLDFKVSYFTIEKFWPSFMKESWLNERYSDFPFKIKIDSAEFQLVGVPLYVSFVSEDVVKIEAHGEEVRAYNFSTNEYSGIIPEISFSENVKLGESLKSKYLNIVIEVDPNSMLSQEDYDLAFKINSHKALVERYKNKLSATPVDETNQNARVVNLNMEINIPSKGEAFINSLIDAYAGNVLAKKNLKGENSIEFINKRIAVLSDSLKKAELALQQFKSSSSLLDVDYAKNSLYNRLDRLEQEKATVDDQLSYYRNTLNSLNSESQADKIVAPAAVGISDPIFNQLVNNYIQLSTRLQQMKYNATDSNPLVTQLERDVADLRQAIKDNISGIISSLSTTQSRLNREIYQARSEANSLPQNERQLTVLERDYQYYQQKYNAMMEKKAEAEVVLATNTTNVETIERAEVKGNGPVWPKPALFMFAAIILGLSFPLAFIVVSDYLDNRVSDKDELENKTKVPLLGMIANGPKDAGVVLKKYPNSAIAESFKFVRINLQYFHQEGNDHVVGITSSISGEGKTFCSANLAATFADSGKRTLLICGDLRKPRIHEYFDLKGPGLTDYLQEFATLDNVIQPTEFRNLDIIAPGSPQDDPTKLFESSNTQKLFDALKQRYDKIIVETPPIGYVADYFVLIKHFDINLFVVRYKYTNKNILVGINDLYKNNKIKNLYLLFNDVKHSGEYGYGYLSNDKGYYTKTKKKALKNPFS